MSPMPYVDGFVVPVPNDRIEEYRSIAEICSKVWQEHGALRYYECVIDEHDQEHKSTFPGGIATKDGETVVFAWIEYESRKHRDEVNAKVMKDPRMNGFDPEKMPFDCERMLYGGFKVFVEALARG